MKKLILALTCLLLAIPCQAETIIVDPNGSANYTTIQEAINASWDGDTVVVRPATYNESIYFNGRAITLTSEDPDDENTVDTTIINPASGDAVTFDFAEGNNSIITGFTIKADNGAGIFCYGTSPKITKNVISDCGDSGIYGENNAQPRIINNTISGNTVHSYQKNACGGGLCGCDGEIKNNTITGNTALSMDGEAYGGGLCGCDGEIKNNTITGNTAHSWDGEAYGGGLGGGLYNCGGPIVNNVIAFNEAGNEGGGIYNCSGNSYNAFWENENGNFGGDATVGTGDFVRDPLFADSDYHLKSTAGHWTDTGWVLDDTNSPCIDAGDPCDPIDVEPNPNGGRINMGAYGGTAEASKSPSGIIEPVCTSYPTMDFNKDCKVDFQDFAIFTQSWLDCNLDPPSACWE